MKLSNKIALSYVAVHAVVLVLIGLPLWWWVDIHGAGWAGTGGALAAYVLAALTASFGIGWFFSRGFLNSIRRLGDFIEALSQGDFRSRPAGRPQNEFGTLEDRLAGMAAQLEKTILELRNNRESTDSILESMFEGVIVVAPDGRVGFMNQVFSDLFGSPAVEATGKSYWEVFRNDKIHGLIRDALDSQRGMSGDFSVHAPDERHFQLQVSPIRSKDTFLGIVVILHDVTSMRRLEKMRSEFVANVSHELKTPLASILGAAETLRGGAVNDLEHRDEFLEMIEHHAGQLKKLIEDLLNLARIEAAGAAIEREDTGIESVFAPLLKAFAPRFKEKRIEIQFEAAPGLAPVSCQPERLKQALSNLIENALKYTDAGGSVKVSVFEVNGNTVFEVSDTGIGISEEDQKRVFERFYRTEKSRSRDAGGTGLGLAIVKHIAEAHGGTVEVRSALPRGSVFVLTIPRT